MYVMAEETITNNTHNKKIMEASGHCKNLIMQDQKKEFSAETDIESNLQTPLMFSRSSSLGSLSGFEQQSFNNNHSFIRSDFSPISNIVSPMLNTSETLKPNKSLISQNVINHVSTKSNQSQVKHQVLDQISFQYDMAFKKPHFLKHSVFEDDIATFKDESSPNILSTAASSLSSLTIDDDEYGENISPNKAGIMKKKLNINVLQMQKISVQEHFQQNPVIDQHNDFLEHSIEHQKISEKLNNFTSTISNDEQFFCESQKNVNYSEQFCKDIKQSSFNLLSINWIKNNKQKSRVGAEGCADQFLHTSNSVKQNQSIPDLDIYNKQDNRIIKEKEEVCKQRSLPLSSHRSIKELNHQVDEVDLNAYEEQLLDQCIRKGMAKVTKRNINDIKPFCWDLNHICLTTRAMLKISDEEILKDKKDERNKRRLSCKGLSRRITNSRFK